ncbi:MAG TPA: SMP-30/gluconolactonase/LRE family protein [Terriglobales bacterium]|nr:SMP-30/gluconolactonase/LRE family protein [Terriglobales bacterium]
MQATPAFRYFRSLAASLLLWAASAHVASSAAEIDTIATGLHFPEGAIFVGNTLYFADYTTSDVQRIAGGKAEQVWHGDGCGANGLVALHDELLVACYDSGTIVRLTLAGQIRETIGHDQAGGTFVSPNDLADDGTGGVYFTTSGSGSILGKVFYRSPFGRVTEVAAGIDYANGLAVSNDHKLLYVVESRKHRLLKFAIGADGRLSDGTEFADLGALLAGSEGDAVTPDGLRIDQHGRLFVALYNGGGFAVLGQDGKLIEKTDLPGAHHASLAIAPDGKSLYLTATDDIPGGGYHGELLRIDNPSTN